jgi:hypothetical protein
MLYSKRILDCVEATMKIPGNVPKSRKVSIAIHVLRTAIEMLVKDEQRTHSTIFISSGIFSCSISFKILHRQTVYVTDYFTEQEHAKWY